SPSSAAVSASRPLMSAARTRAPSRTKTLVDALAIPDPAPVITATLPSSSAIRSSRCRAWLDEASRSATLARYRVLRSRPTGGDRHDHHDDSAVLRPVRPHDRRGSLRCVPAPAGRGTPLLQRAVRLLRRQPLRRRAAGAGGSGDLQLRT